MFFILLIKSLNIYIQYIHKPFKTDKIDIGYYLLIWSFHIFFHTLNSFALVN